MWVYLLFFMWVIWIHSLFMWEDCKLRICNTGRISSNHSLEAAFACPAVVSYTLRKNLSLRIHSRACRMKPIVAINFLFTSLLIPPIDTISAYAAGSLFPLKDMATDPLRITITNCIEFKGKFIMGGVNVEICTVDGGQNIINTYVFELK